MNTVPLCSLLRSLSVVFWLAWTPVATAHGAANGPANDHVKFSAQFQLVENSRQGLVTVKADIAPGWYLYAQDSEGGTPTKLEFADSSQFQSGQDWVPSRPADFEMDEFLGAVLKHKNQVAWTTRIELNEGVAPEQLELEISVTGQVCQVLCERIDETVTASFAGYQSSLPGVSATAAGDADGNADSGAAPDPGDPPVDADRVATDSRGVDDDQPDTGGSKGMNEVGTVRPDADGEMVEGSQKSAESGLIEWDTFSEATLQNLAFITDENGQLVPLDIDKHPMKSGQTTEKLSLLSLLKFLGFGFLGGLILNVMPCVLPVIGLKIMSFVQQSGDDRGKTFHLNLVYSAGILFVFLILATLGVALGLTWGKQFQSQTFTIVLSAVVFVFALSLIGIWEIPIPGFVGSNSASKLAEQEGFAGAFFKGILTTILATPCTGPFIIPVLSWAFKQHPAVIYGTFIAMGIGMASPFLVIGANPKLVSFLPKPGNWMVVFKQLMGFVLLGTVVWLMRSIRFEVLLPVVTMLFGLWLACWYIGRMPVTASMATKLRNWSVAVLLAVVCGFLAFGPIEAEAVAKFDRNYQPRPVVVNERLPGEYTLLVDFTADW